MNFGIDQLLNDSTLIKELKARRVGLVAHPASVTRNLIHSVDALISAGINIRVAFGPQHGMRGEKQDNMIESDDYIDPTHNIPVYSLYGQHRYPTSAMLGQFDILLFDLQDIGCRIYTYITTLKYFIDACAGTDKSIWVLDRPNPAGRAIDGTYLLPGHTSFVGCDELIMRHGLTVGELAGWMKLRNKADIDLKVVPVESYDPTSATGFGWPVDTRSWVNPSPNASSVNMCRSFAGTVLLEGTTLSEGRGTTTPLEVMGAPDLPIDRLLEMMRQTAPEWLEGVLLRPVHFEPMFHKHQGQLCHGLQIHTDHPAYQPDQFKPYRLVALLLKCLRNLQPDYDLWRQHEYEYELDRIPIDVINGGSDLRAWVDDETATIADLEHRLLSDESRWREERIPHLMY